MVRFSDVDYNKNTATPKFFFFYVGTPKESIFFDHFLWPIFLSSLHIHITNYISFMIQTVCGQLPCTASTPVFPTCGYSHHKVIFFCTVYIRKPDIRLSNGQRVGHNLCPTFEWKKQDGGDHSKAGPDISYQPRPFWHE